jgi:hypothetical protein
LGFFFAHNNEKSAQRLIGEVLIEVKGLGLHKRQAQKEKREI